MNDYYLIDKISKYVGNYKSMKTLAHVNRLWREQIRNMMYCLICNFCGSSGIRVWKHFIGTFDNNGGKFELLCANCIDKRGDVNYTYVPAIPLFPGASRDFWWTTDVPIEWLHLWIMLDPNV